MGEKRGWGRERGAHVHGCGCCMGEQRGREEKKEKEKEEKEKKKEKKENKEKKKDVGEYLV